MATYVYETTDPAKPRRRFEVKQSMLEAPLTQDPATGEPIVRVITGGYGYVQKGSSTPSRVSTSGGSCGSGCGCH